MSYTPYSHPSDFYWDSKLDAGRKAEIIEWTKSLTPTQRAMLEDIVGDTRRATDFDVREELS